LASPAAVGGLPPRYGYGVRKPTAEIALAEGQVRALLATQFPDLAGLSLRLVAEGWDNSVWRLGDLLAVRLPRRAAAAEQIRHEQQVLPLLAPRATVPVPQPLRMGEPQGPMPWAWSVVPWFPGRVMLELPRESRHGGGAALGRFLRGIHVPALAPAPANPVRGVPLSDRAEVVTRRLAGGLVPRSDELRAVWADALSAPVFDRAAVWLHGDLHPGNIIVSDSDDDRSSLTAVVDFGDVTAGDPATDLAAAWLCFGPDGRRAFRTAYGDDDAALWLRARGWAAVIASALCESSADDPPMARLGRETIDELLRCGEPGNR
jgi:aminoglycoside phosphotransferase (APT) family kinase protein